MQITTLKIAELSADPANVRKHDERNIETIMGSLRRFGQQKPIVVDMSNVVRAGNGTLEAAKRIGWETIEAYVIDLTGSEMTAYAIADNRTSELAEWDEEALAAVLEGLQFDDEALLEAAGFNEDELAALMADIDLPDDEPITEDEVPEPPVDPITKPGDLWILGWHRVLCGDSTKAEDVGRLMDGAKINIAFTSPPYASQRKYDESSGFKPIPPDEFVKWFEPIAANVKKHLVKDGSWFVNIKPCADGLDTSLYVFDLVCAHVRQWGWHFATEFCWERSGVPKSVTQRFKNQFEPIYQFALNRWKMRPESVRHESESVPKAIGKGAGNTGWGNERQGKGGDAVMPNEHGPGMAYPGNRLSKFHSESLGHTAAFPVGLPSFFIKAYTDESDNIYEPFLGSGTTLIAAEQLGRTCYGMEISPQYCDVIVKRWENLTGEKATCQSATPE